MIPKDKLRKIRRTIRRIEITTRKVVNETFAGQYHSVFKGRGMEFDEVREYAPGDEIRSIDWNVTSRMGRPYTKQFVEERELTVMLVVDASASMDFGTGSEFKNERAAELCALLAFSAIKNNDRVGLVIFTDRIELHLPPRKGRTHALRIVREVLFFEPQRRRSDIAGAVEYVSRTHARKSVVFLLSDFIPAGGDHTGFRKPVSILARKHDLVAVRLLDPREDLLVPMGLVRVRDPETGEELVVDTSSRRWRRDYHSLRSREASDLERFFKANGIDHLDIRTDLDYENDLIKFFRRRASRR
ncbi:MAG TPA: DUF58 domain-containing protein [Acidobacteriota bacterium]|nr:DUF58 domain-containing protein [Acidobacteriota bacterium]